MSLDYINEAFKKLNLLNEETFDTSLNGINKLADYIDNDDDSIRVIDPEAETTDELSDSYIGKVIINCNICHSNIFKNKEDIVIDSDGNVNLEDQCPYCGEEQGFVVVGEIKPFEPVETEEVKEDDVEVEVDGEETPIEEPVKDDSEEVDESLTEAMNNVNVETDDTIVTVNSDDSGKVTVSTEPKETDIVTEDEMIAPVEDETISEIEANNVEEEPIDEFSEEENLEEIPEEEAPVEDEEDIDIEEVAEESFDHMVGEYLNEVYDNVTSYKSTSISTSPEKLVIEGLITFKSGATKNTGFIFEAKGITSDNKLVFTGSNKHFSINENAFNLNGRMEGKILIMESLSYDYTAGDNKITGSFKYDRK